MVLVATSQEYGAAEAVEDWRRMAEEGGHANEIKDSVEMLSYGWKGRVYDRCLLILSEV